MHSFLVGTLLLAGVGSPARTLDSYLSLRDYPAAIAAYSGQLGKDPSDGAAMRNLARVYDHQHRFDSSAAWWNRARSAEPGSDSAVAGYWQALFRRDAADDAALALTRSIVAREAAQHESDTTAGGLTLAYDGLALADTARAVTAALRLIDRFPDSPRAYELIGGMFYDSLYPVWSNDTLKLPIIRRFLVRLPVTEWRSTFYQFLLSSLFSLKDTTELRRAAAEMVRDDTLDPFRHRYAAAMLNRLKVYPEQAAVYARSAIALAPTATRPRNKPPAQWDIEYPALYTLARVALAEALMAQRDLAAAKGWLSDALSHWQWDAQQEATPAPIYCLFGEIQAAEGDTGTALTSLAYAMQCGDSRNTWTGRADSGFTKLSGLAGRSTIDSARHLLGYDGAAYTDCTDSVGLAGRRESRVAWGDYNNDGFEDLLLAGCVLLRNDSGLRFTDVSDSVGLAGAAGRGGIWADYDNDGWLDFWMSAGGNAPDRLWRNDHGQFRDVTDRTGTPSDTFPTEGAAWSDFDNNGWVDLYCANYENWAAHSYFPDRLWRNRRGRFDDITAEAGIAPPHGTDLAGRGVNWGDFDDDGDQDCYVADYRLCENLLWENGRGRFANRAGQLGIAGDEVDGWYGHTIGAEWADFDNDGDLDLFTADLAHPRYIEFSNRSRLYENQGSRAVPRFRDRRADVGIRYEETHSDPAWADVDNDGDLDLYITSIYEGRRSFLYENRLLPSNGTFAGPRPRAFSEITWLSGTRCYNGWGCAFADFDNDGDQDLVVGSGSGLRLFRNTTRNGNHWLKVKVIGRRSNRSGIGCRVTVSRGGDTLVREVEGGKGTTSQNSLVQHFGLGRSPDPVTVTVRFGPGRTQTLRHVVPDRLIVVRER